MNPSISARGQVAPELAPEDRPPLGYRMVDRGAAAHRLGGDLGEPRLHMAYCALGLMSCTIRT